MEGIPGDYHSGIGFSFTILLFICVQHHPSSGFYFLHRLTCKSPEQVVGAGAPVLVSSCGDYPIIITTGKQVPSDIITRVMTTASEDLRKQLKRLKLLRDETIRSFEKKRLIKLATENCTDETVLQWLRTNSEHRTFNKLVDMFDFLKKHVDEEEKKNHSDSVHITFIAHGSIRDFMIPARCLLPLPTINDVVLYAPWNCVTSGLGYGVATGKLKPQHRVFYCGEKETCKIPDDKHRPLNLPDHWNSMKKAVEWMIPNITVSPLRPDDGVWKRFESLAAKYGPPGRDHIVIPFILPGQESESVPFSVVILALSLVLLSSRFKATVHFSSCLSDSSAGQKFDRKYLQEQYACAMDDTGMTCSSDAFQVKWLDYYKDLFY